MHLHRNVASTNLASHSLLGKLFMWIRCESTRARGIQKACALCYLHHASAASDPCLMNSTRFCLLPSQGSSDEFIDANIQLALRLAKLLNDAKKVDSKLVMCLLLLSPIQSFPTTRYFRMP